ncbi:DUF7601 domain-containing protein [Faecalimonas sp.]
MANTIRHKIAKFKEQRNYKKKLYACFIVLAFGITIGVLGSLTQPASTMSGQIVCGLKEHTHTDECYERQLICDKEEGENHTHNEECWTTVLVCSKQEHTHIAECYDVKESENVQNGDILISATQKQELEQLRKNVPAEYTDIRTVQLSEGGAVYLFAQPDSIPKQVELKVELLNETSEEFGQAEKRVKDTNIVYEHLKALDISLVDEKGTEVEPTEPIYVSIDFNNLLPEKVNPESIQIQHHKEILVSEEDSTLENVDVVLESVMDDEKGVLKQRKNTQTYMATFLTDSFSVYTITSSGWPDLKIRIQCVDEYGRELLEDHRPNDITWGDAYKPDASFEKVFTAKEHDVIPGYKYDGKAYFMRNGEYESQIYGIRREKNEWYYYTKEDRTSKVRFSNQPNFTVIDHKDPPDFIRLIYRKVTDIDVKYMDDAGIFGENEIPLKLEDAPNGKNPDVIKYIGTELDIGDTDIMPKSRTYFFLGKAYVGEPTYDHQVVKVIRENGKPYGVTLEGEKILISKEEPLKLMYRKVQTDQLEKVNTVSTAEKGMKIHLFNYHTSINNNHNLQFRPQGNSGKPYNNWTGKDGGIYTGIVEETLVNGYPRVNGESLNYLFDPVLCREQLNTGQVQNVHTNLDHLFKKDKDGYYHYDSMTNFATIIPENGGGISKDSDGGDFLVYKQPVLPGHNGIGNNAKFLPFDTYANANRLKEGNNPTNKEYHFGMTMEAEFTIPPGGKVPDADGGHVGLRDMIFEFNGDDDVWVFIDDKLALDLGGIHGRYGGKINFRTGEVVTNAPPTPHGGRYQKNLYNIQGDPNTMSDDELKQAREDAGFGKYTQHTFKFFYLERGEGASNCELRFNLVPVQHGLVVGKRIPESMKDVATEHMWYQFQVETEFKGRRQPLSHATYERIQWKPGADPIIGGQLLGAGKTDEAGRFWLRAGERADFEGAIDLKNIGLTDTEKMNIYVSEVLPNGTVAPQPTAWSGKEEEPGTYMLVEGTDRKLVPPLYDYQDENITVKLHTKKTETVLETKNISNTDETVYQAKLDTRMYNEFNWIDFENNIGNLAGLNITKQARYSNQDPISDVPFAIRVELWDTKDKIWIPLPEGTEYWILDKGVVAPGEKLPEKDKLHLDKSANGLISIKDGQSIHLHVLPGTKYRVSEALTLEEAAVYTTTYEGSSSNKDETLEEFEEASKKGIGNKTGIQAGSQHYVTIHNTGDPVLMPKGSFVLAKETKGVVPPNTKFNFNLQIQDYTSGQAEISYKATYYGTPEGVRAQGREDTIVLKKGTAGQYEGNLSLYSGEIVVIEGLPVEKALRVQEVFGADQIGQYKVSFHEEGKEPVVGVENIVTNTIRLDRVVKVTCVNESNLKDKSTLSISKKVKRTDQSDGNPLPEDMERAFVFQIMIQKSDAVSLDYISAKKILANGQTRYFTLKFEPKGENFVANVTLKHGEMVKVDKLPIGVQAIVQELNHDGYAVSMNGVSGDRITVDLGFNTGVAYEVKCVNMTGVELPETGGHGLIPYFLTGIGMMLGAIGLFFLSYRRKRD